MATLHNLSVLTNLCVKSPINPHTGLSKTANEREPATLSSDWHGRDADFLDDPVKHELNHFATRSLNFDVRNDGRRSDGECFQPSSSEQAPHSMSDADFYQALTKLRAENRKTLDVYEQLYNDKLDARGDLQVSKPKVPAKVRSTKINEPLDVVDDAILNNRKHVSSLASDYGYMSKSLDAEFTNTTSSDKLFEARKMYSSYRMPVDKVRDMSAKPPTGRLKTSPYRSTSPTFSNTRRRTGKENYWKVPVDSSDAETDDDVVDGEDDRYSVKSCDDSRSQSVSRIQDMWNNFSVDDFAPITRGRSSSLSLQEPADGNNVSEWRNRITVPKPFKMTLRDENKAKSKTMLDLEAELDERREKEESEILKQFKARPVPAHVYIPLYDEIMEVEETKRRQNKLNCELILKSTEKPFKFMKREEEKVDNCRSRSLPLARRDTNRGQFKAKPFPEHIFDDRVNDKIMEEEEYRQIRMQMRSEDLLRSSSLPPNMTAKGKDYTAGKSRERMYADRARRAGLTVEHKFRPTINGTVPEFDDIHRQFQSEMRNTKQTRQATVCRPFKLRTSSRKQNNHSDDLKGRRNNSRPRRALRGSSDYHSGSRYSMDDCIPMKMTAATQLRASATQSRLQRSLDLEEEEEAAARRRRLIDRRLKKQISQRAEANDSSAGLKLNARNKLKEYKKTERLREEEYQKELDDIMGRVQQRPLLFERASQTNAQHAAERRYKETLSRAGLDEDFIVRKGAGAKVRLDSHVSNGSGMDDITSGSRKLSQQSNSGGHYTQEFDDGDSEDDINESISSDCED